MNFSLDATTGQHLDKSFYLIAMVAVILIPTTLAAILLIFGVVKVTHNFIFPNCGNDVK